MQYMIRFISTISSILPWSIIYLFSKFYENSPIAILLTNKETNKLAENITSGKTMTDVTSMLNLFMVGPKYTLAS